MGCLMQRSVVTSDRCQHSVQVRGARRDEGGAEPRTAVSVADQRTAVRYEGKPSTQSKETEER